jgi:hypothetical protein
MVTAHGLTRSKHMNADGISIDLGTLFLGTVVIVLFLSLRTIFIYFFGSSGPLMRNTYARLEANRKPEELIPEARAYEFQKQLRAILVIIGLMWVLYWVAPEASVELATALWQKIVESVQVLTQWLLQFAKQLLQ